MFVSAIWDFFVSISNREYLFDAGVIFLKVFPVVEFYM